MKRFILLTIVIAFIVGSPVSILANNSTIDPQEASKFCKANDDFDYNNHGQCVRYYVTCYGPGNSGPVCVCQGFMDSSPNVFFDAYNNFGECVSHLRRGFIPE